MVGDDAMDHVPKMGDPSTSVGVHEIKIECAGGGASCISRLAILSGSCGRRGYLPSLPLRSAAIQAQENKPPQRSGISDRGIGASLPNDQRKSGQASEEARFIQIALKEAGYTGQLTAMDSHQFDVAARLLVKLFRAGVTDSGAVSGELRKHFGYVPVETLQPVRHRKATQGMVTTRTANDTHPAPTLQGTAPQKPVSSRKDQLQADLARTRKYLTDDAIQIAAQEAGISGARLRGEPTSLARQELDGYFARQRYHRFELSLIEARIKAQ